MNPVLIILMILGLLATGCDRAPKEEQTPQARLQVAVSIPPQKTFVEELAGPLAEVRILVRPGASPATYEPTPGQMRALAEADLYLAIGVPFEQVWLPRFRKTHPGLRIVHTEGAVDRLPLPSSPCAHHHAGEGHAHTHEALDPHIWLSPPRVRTLLTEMADALIEVEPGLEAAIRERETRALARVEALHRELQDTLEPAAGSAFLVFHPSWGYFARDYNLDMIPVEVGGQEPSPAELARMSDLARERDLRTIFVQPEFSTRSAELLARELNGRTVSLSPLSTNWAGTLRRAASAIAGESANR